MEKPTARTMATKLHLNPDDWQRLKIIARSEERTASGIIRLCIRDYIARHEAANNHRECAA